MLVRDVLAEVRSVLMSPLEAEILLRYLTGSPREKFLAHPDLNVSDEHVANFRKLCTARASGIPIAYLTHHKEFFAMDFYVDERVLIPRPETELLVEEVIGFVKKDGQIFRGMICDMGTGSGCIAVALAKNLPAAKVLAVDISKKSLEVAKKNAKRHEVNDRIEFVESDLLSAVSHYKIDILVANLPYIGRSENHLIEKDVLENEPKLALFGGEIGTELYERLFAQIAEMSQKPMYLSAEMGFLQQPAICALIKKHFGDIEIMWKNDLAGLPRIFTIKFS